MRTKALAADPCSSSRNPHRPAATPRAAGRAHVVARRRHGERATITQQYTVGPDSRARDSRLHTQHFCVRMRILNGQPLERTRSRSCAWARRSQCFVGPTPIPTHFSACVGCAYACVVCTVRPGGDMLFGVYQTFAKVFSKFAVWSRKAESRRKLRARLEPRATILYGRAKLCVSRLQKVHFHGKSCAAHTRKPETEPIRQKSGFCLGQHSKMKTPTK